MSSAIAAAFNKHLNRFATLENIEVAWEGLDFTPTADAYLRGFYLPGLTTGAALGTDAPNRHVGIFQIDCIYPIGRGWGDCAEMAEKVRAYFKRGTKLGDDDEIVISSASPGPGMVDGDRYKIPVSISYWATLAN